MNGGAITIGRNIGNGVPLPAETWQAFIADVRNAITATGGQVFLTAYGVGEWQGVKEDSAVFTFAGEVSRVAAQLPMLAAVYGQDAIAVVEGDSRLVMPASVAQAA